MTIKTWMIPPKLHQWQWRKVGNIYMVPNWRSLQQVFVMGKNISITTSWDNDPNKHPIMDHILEFFKNISYVHVLICIFID